MHYVSSKLKHAQMWKAARDNGWDIISSWIDGEKLEGHEALQDMWDTYFTEIAHCTQLVLYVEPGEKLKGALIEVGAALMLGKKVVVIFTSGDMQALQDTVGTWIYDENVTVVNDIESVTFG